HLVLPRQMGSSPRGRVHIVLAGRSVVCLSIAIDCPVNMRRLSLSLVFALLTCTVCAQGLPTLTPTDYDQWERLGAFELDPTGSWIVIAVSRVDEDRRLELHRADGSGEPVVLEHGTRPAFSSDGKWLAYHKGVSAEAREETEEPASDRLGLLDLTAVRDTVLMPMKSAAFRDDGQWIAVLGESVADTVGADLLVFRPGTEVRTTLGNVDDWAWQDQGPHLAATLRTATDGGNGIQVFNPDRGTIRTLHSGEDRYQSPTWREESTQLAVFSSVTDEEREGDAQDVLMWPDATQAVAAMQTLRSVDRPELADSLGLSLTGNIRYSPDGGTLFLGVNAWLPKEADSPADTTLADPEAGESEDPDPEEEPADVQVWHWDDDTILRGQEWRAPANARRTLLAAWRPASDNFVVVGSEYDEPVNLAGDARRWGVVADYDPYHVDRRWSMGGADWYRVDLDSGKRTLIATNVFGSPQIGPAGEHVLVYHQGGWTATALTSLETVRFEGSDGADALPDFTMGPADNDTPGPARSWGVGAWWPEDAAAVLQGKHDLWRADFATGAIVAMTAGDSEGIRYRAVNMDPEASFFDRAVVEDDGTLWLTVMNLKEKTEGYARWVNGTVRSLVWEDAQISGLHRAMDAEVFAFRSERWDTPPAVISTSDDFRSTTETTSINPFQDTFAWGHSELLHYTTDAGHELQAVLAYPADFQEGEQYPLILYQYEKLSNGLHNYRIPSERTYYDFQTWSQRGYFVLMPDIVYEAGRPGPSALDAVGHALDAAVATGHVDAEAMGLIGHSWGGYQAAYLPTRTNRFAASVAGAAITDFISFPGTVHWRGGGEEFGHWENGQARMALPPWEDLAGHLESSPVNFIQDLETPVLLMHGDNDGVVDFRQGLQYYNYARRARKPVVMLMYPGAGHGLSDKTQQIDYHRRILEWFGHYLKGETPAAWITNGETWEERSKRLD
ncbi:MAG: dipeptidyl aminopeptidase/acylaminoacyl peptidase, partial [Rhodothermales bacterium]